MKPSYLRGFAAAILSALLVLPFQNCSESLPDVAVAFEQNSFGGPWNKGDVFNWSLVPGRSQMMNALVSKIYMPATGPRAIAIAASGLGFVSAPAGGTQADANRAAQQGCFAITGGQPCALLAAGDRFEVGREELASSYTFTMSPSSATVVAAEIPFVTSALATSTAAAYNASTQANRAMVVSLDGLLVTVINGAANVNGAVASAAEATRIALERCEMMALISPCIPYAEGAAVRFNPTQINRAGIIDYNKLSPASFLPGQTVANGVAQINNRWNTIPTTANAKGMIYISADGRFGVDINTNPATADANALAACNTGANPNYPCFKYADSTVNPQIAFTGSNLTGKIFSYDVHCNAVPRLSCQHHKNMGCASGTRYTIHSSGAVQLELCM